MSESALHSEGVAIRRDQYGNEMLSWMGNAHEEQTVAVRDLIRRDVTTAERLADMKRRVEKLEHIREYVTVTRDSLLTVEQKANIVRKEKAQSVCASSIRSSVSAAVLRALCHICGDKVQVTHSNVVDHIASCRAAAESIVAKHGLTVPAVPVSPVLPAPGQSRDTPTAGADAVDEYNRQARKCFVQCMREGVDGRKVTVIELGRQLEKASR
jgi:hypothetical protein